MCIECEENPDSLIKTFGVLFYNIILKMTTISLSNS